MIIVYMQSSERSSPDNEDEDQRYPVALVCLSPLSGSSVASFPQELYPPVPKPMMELWVKQSFCWLTMMPILALKITRLSPTISNPSLLQIRCKEACEPATFFQVSRSSKVARYFPSAINESRVGCLVDEDKTDLWSNNHIEADPRRVFSSTLVTLFLVSRSHSCQQHLDRSFRPYRNGNDNEKYSEID